MRQKSCVQLPLSPYMRQKSLVFSFHSIASQRILHSGSASFLVITTRNMGCRNCNFSSIQNAYILHAILLHSILRYSHFINVAYCFCIILHDRDMEELQVFAVCLCMPNCSIKCNFNFLSNAISIIQTNNQRTA